MLPLSKVCAELLVDQDRTVPVTCNMCDSKVPIFGKTNIAYKAAVIHACHHLGQMLFICRICNFESKYQDGMRSHIIKKHPSLKYKENAIDKSGEYYDEIKQLIRRCFDKKDPEYNNASLEERER